ncbi:pectin lyase-like family protein [Dictyostelium discoideum AX4]|uniref:Pectin lyase-like family protein n=1 Tax=Dictyostelium discoideum TaxID=44689 RepID=Q54YC0_DICDI|nr:pectin lyase-like family protein [Dictyostelium discoideum AX4]EAL68329.1 pectin lyase-like family protein [Dictyostelium discoideum AX4]|eukprot:XP_642282.1 pectin lyase-like family protein [Dictyostelium discoideum AX4]
MLKKSLFIYLFIFFNFIIKITTAATSVTYYVSVNNGNDNIPCGESLEKSCQSIQYVFNQYNSTYLNSQDIIEVMILLDDGEYIGENNVNFNIYNMTITIQPINNSKTPSPVTFNGINSAGDRVFNITEPYLIKTNETTIQYGINSTSLTLNNLNFINFNPTIGNGNGTIGNGAIIFIDIFNSSLSLSINKCNFNNNQGNKGGVIYMESEFYSDGNNLVEISIKSSQFTNNNATISGGVAYLDGFNDIYIDTCLFDNSYSPVSGTSTLFISNGEFIEIRRSNFTRNQIASTVELFGIQYKNGSMVKDCLFDGNVVNGKGGAISMYLSWLSVDGTLFNNNYAGAIGGAIFATGVSSYLLVANSKFIDNKSSGAGGAIATQGSVYTSLNNCEFISNSANAGGSLSFEYSNQIHLRNCTISGNVGVGQGGAIYSSYSTISMDDTKISANQAYQGGAVYCSASTLNITSSNIPLNGNTDLGNGTDSYEWKGEDGIKVNDYGIYCALTPTYTYCTVNGDTPYSKLCGESDVTELSGLTAGQIAGIVIGCTIGAGILAFGLAWVISKTTIKEHFIRLRSSSTSNTSYSLN